MEQEQCLLWFGTIFGRDLPQSALLKLRSAVLTGSLPQPRVVLVSGGVQGHEAAYHRKESTILIDREMVRRAREDNAEAWKLLVCLLEEFGHHLDNLLRTLYSKVGGDAPLDEGARVACTLIDFGWSRGQQQREFATHVTIDTRGNAGWILDRVRQWMPGHQKVLQRLGSRTWMTEWTRESSKHVQDMQQRAEQLMKRGQR